MNYLPWQTLHVMGIDGECRATDWPADAAITFLVGFRYRCWKMGVLVEEAVRKALRSLADQDKELARSVLGGGSAFTIFLPALAQS